MKRLVAALLLTAWITLGAAAAPPQAQSPAASLALDLALQPGIGGETAWKVHQSDHFRVVYGNNADRAATQARLLELTYHRFFEVFGDYGVAPVADPMVCLFFENKDDYLRYARRVDRVDMAWTVAYYSAKTNRIAFYRYAQPRAADNQPARRAVPSEDQLYGSASGEPAAGHHDHPVSLASATHEAAHQLAFNSGLQKRGVRYPLWVSEGLASNFEMAAPDAGFGPDHNNPARQARLERLQAGGDLLPLHTFVAVTHPPTDDARATDAVYAQAWGLFQFLYREHGEALSLYLDDLRHLPAGERDPQALRAEFIRRFGPLTTLQRQWHDWVAAGCAAGERRESGEMVPARIAARPRP